MYAGLCTGSIAAAALSCAQNVFDITRVGVQAVIVAFRIGLHVHRRAAMMGFSGDSQWSAVVANLSESAVEELISSFCQASVCAPPYLHLNLQLVLLET